MAMVDWGADRRSGAVHRGGREGTDGPVISHNRRTRDGPVKDPELRTRLGDDHRGIGQMALSGPQIQEPVTPVIVQNKDTLVHSNKTPVTESVPDAVAAQGKELSELKEELAAQEALRTRERELKKAVEEEQRKTVENLRRAEENLRKGHMAFDRLKEEKEKVL